MKQLLILLIAIFIGTAIYSQPGTIDNTFGNKGIVSTKMPGSISTIIQQKDGKLLTAGGFVSNPNGYVARFLPDGTLDSSFGNAGYAGIVSGIGAADMALQGDGKILIIGTQFNDNHQSQFVVVRFQPDGIIDPSFGTNGIAPIPNFKDYSGYDKIKLESDGSIIIAGGGQTNILATIGEYMILSHLSAEGKFDYGFGSEGRVLQRFPDYTGVNERALAIQKDGKILLTGYVDAGGDDQDDYVLCRYNSDGTIDKSFGNGGTVISQGVEGLVGHDDPCGIVVQEDGKIVIGGTSAGYDFIIYITALRYNTDGSIDKDFGKNGRVFVSFEGETPNAYTIIQQQDGKFILAGRVSYKKGNSYYSDFAMCRINTDGGLDSSFAVDGKQQTSFSGGDATAYCATVQQDGKIVLGGSNYDENKGDSYLLVRYNGDKGQKSLIAKMKHFLHSHGINWQGLPANIRYYSVQYSKTGSGFAEWGKVSATGSNDFQQYNFTVNDAGYYRVVAVDNKGYKTFSNKVMVSAADIASLASVYPNPAKDYVTVNGLQPNEPASISISNGSGAVLAKGTSNGGTQYRATTSNMQPGTYYINITTKGKTEALTFVKE